MPIPSTHELAEAAEIAFAWVVAGSERDQMLPALDDRSDNAHWRNAICEKDAVTSTHLLAVIIKGITSGWTQR
jgi:hypothetical protein